MVLYLLSLRGYIDSYKKLGKALYTKFLKPTLNSVK